MAFHAVFASIFNVSNFVILTKMLNESSGGVMVRALASHQCGPGSIPRLGVIRVFSLLVLFSALTGFSPGYSSFTLSSKNCIWLNLICINWRGVWNKALSDFWCNVKFSSSFTIEYKEIWKENLVIYQKSLKPFLRHPCNFNLQRPQLVCLNTK